MRFLYAPEFDSQQEDDVRVHARNNVIYHDPIAAGQSPLKITRRKYLKNIEKPEEDKSDKHMQYCGGNEKHGPLKTDHLIDDYVRCVLFAEHPLSSMGYITCQTGEGHYKYEIHAPG